MVARRPCNLLIKDIHVKSGKVADIVVLGKLLPGDKVKLLGWEYGKEAASWPTAIFDYNIDILNHYKPAHKLRPMSDLKHLLPILPAFSLD